MDFDLWVDVAVGDVGRGDNVEAAAEFILDG